MTLASAVPITVAAFKSRFDREFVYGAGIDAIRDKDIENALNESLALFNSSLWDTDDQIDAAYAYLGAHVLVTNIKAAGGLKKTGHGINSTGSFPIGNKSAGGLSVGYAVPSAVTDNPALSQFNTTAFGQKYLQLLLPQLVGYIGTVAGGINP